jgi:hypothetical protein
MIHVLAIRIPLSLVISAAACGVFVAGHSVA